MHGPGLINRPFLWRKLPRYSMNILLDFLCQVAQVLDRFLHELQLKERAMLMCNAGLESIRFSESAPL